MPKDATNNLSRRRVLQAGGVGAAMVAGAAVLPGAARAAATRPGPISREVPGTGQRVPVLALGAFQTFDTLPDHSRAHIHEVVRRFWQAGGRVFDVSALYGASETNLGEALQLHGISDRAFLCDKVWSTGEYLWDDSHAARNLERSMQRLFRSQPLDVIQCHSLINVDIIVPLMHAWKAEGRVRLVGVTHHELAYFDRLADWVERGTIPPDFVQVRYSIFARQAEQRIFPAAANRGVGILTNMPLEKGRLHHIIGNRPLPRFFARELDISTWSQFLLKWVMGNRQVTSVICATSNPDHVAENAAAMRGPLPDRWLRARMLRHMQSIPGFDKIESLPWYPDRTYNGLVNRAQRAVLARSPWRP